MDQDKVLERGRKALARVRANRVGRSAYELADAFEALDALMSMSYPLCRECQEEGRDGCNACRPPKTKTCTMVVGNDDVDVRTCDKKAFRQLFAGTEPDAEPIDEYVCAHCFMGMLTELPTEEAKAACRAIWRFVQ